MIDSFRLGFANRTLGYRLPPKAVKAGAAIRAQLQRLGVLRESGHEHLTGSLVVPLFDERRRRWWRCTGGRSRRVFVRERRCICICRGRIAACGTWLRSKRVEEIILCESLIDALTFWCAGFRHVTTRVRRGRVHGGRCARRFGDARHSRRC